jgi:DNA polymerase-3 subunit delta'
VAKSTARRAPTPLHPAGLGGIVGHRPLIELLRRAVRRNRVPQSLLFAGPAGVGKRTVAVALAQAVNCPARREAGGDDACGACPICVRIARGQFSDVTLLDRGDDASIKIDALRRRVLDLVGYRPFEGARRVFIVDGAEDLTEQAQDALLKTLEEPPPGAVLILVTAFPDTLRPTIQSRCRRLRFAPLAEEDVARVLIEVRGLDAAEARVLAATSGGSVSRALAGGEGHLDNDRESALALLAAARTDRIDARLKAAAALARHGSKRRDREALGARLAVLGSLLRDLTVLAADAGSELANADLDADLRQLTTSFDPGRLSAAFSTLTEAHDALDRNASPKIVSDWVAVRL